MISESPTPSDATLVRAYRAGDVHAFEELHKRYVSSIYRLVRRKLGDGLLAEDIAQETFLKSLRTMDKVDESFNFGGWIHTVARNLCLDELRRRQRDPRADDSGEKDLMVRLPAPTAGSDPSIAYENTELRHQVWAVAQRLPEKYRLVLTLRELQGLSYRQIGKSMKISESAVETLLYRARLRFKEEFLSAQGGPALTCEEVAPLLAPYLAGKLRRSQADAVRQHLASCVRCSRKVGPRRSRPAPALASDDGLAELQERLQEGLEDGLQGGPQGRSRGGADSGPQGGVEGGGDGDG